MPAYTLTLTQTYPEWSTVTEMMMMTMKNNHVYEIYFAASSDTFSAYQKF